MKWVLHMHFQINENNRKSVKEQLLVVLKKNNGCTMKEIMPHFSISEIAVRRHLQELIRNGFIKEEKVKQDIGRPFHTFNLTSKGHNTFPNHYEELPVQLLNDLQEIQGDQVVDQLLRKLMDREIAFLADEVAVEDFDQRVADLKGVLCARGYMMDCIKTEDGDYMLKNYNCPLYNVASCYQGVCDHEKTMFKKVLPDSVIEQHSNIVT